MSVTVEAFGGILDDEKILEGCTEAREAVARVCVAFRQSGRFPRPTFNMEIGIPVYRVRCCENKPRIHKDIALVLISDFIGWTLTHSG
jgi:hypothetical protein